MFEQSVQKPPEVVGVGHLLILKHQLVGYVICSEEGNFLSIGRKTELLGKLCNVIAKFFGKERNSLVKMLGKERSKKAWVALKRFH